MESTEAEGGGWGQVGGELDERTNGGCMPRTCKADLRTHTDTGRENPATGTKCVYTDVQIEIYVCIYL